MTTVRKTKLKVTRREEPAFDANETDELVALRARIAQLEAAAGKSPRKRKGPYDDLAERAFEDNPHWDPRITRYYPAGSAEVKDMRREPAWTNVNDATDYVVGGVHLRHIGAWEEQSTLRGKGAKVERTVFRVVEVQK